MAALPEFYFRVRETGAAVFRVDTENRNRRLELEPIAVANLRNGQIRPQGDRPLSAAEEAAIRAWMEARKAELAARELDDVRRAIDGLNAVAQWAQARASDDEIEAVADALLLAMHDLRGVLVRRKAARLMREDGEA
jgi:hypothetical protein